MANARRHAEAGFTTIRDVGGNADVVVAMKRPSPGRDRRAAHVGRGPPLGPTGGHGDPANGLDPELSHPRLDEALIDSPEAARRTVRACAARAPT